MISITAALEGHGTLLQHTYSAVCTNAMPSPDNYNEWLKCLSCRDLILHAQLPQNANIPVDLEIIYAGTVTCRTVFVSLQSQISVFWCIRNSRELV